MGIDILKIVAMFLIIIGHLLGQYGIGDGLSSTGSAFYTYQLLGSISCCAVNCYALCTGYLMINRIARPSRLIELWFQIIFYSVGVTLLFFLLMRYGIIPARVKISAVQWLTNFTPILRNSWWYASCYFGLYLFIPILNNLILKSGKSQIDLFLMVSIVLASASALLYGDGLCFKFGYSVLWLVILYVAGAAINIYDIKGKHCLAKWGGVVLLTLFLSYVLDSLFIYRITGEAKSGRILRLYTSPLTIFASIQLFLFFSSIKDISSKRITRVIQMVAISTFGIYLIHTHDVVWDYFENYLSVNDSALELIVVTLSVSFGVFIVCFIIDLIRRYLFEMLNVKGLSDKFFELITQSYSYFIHKN